MKAQYIILFLVSIGISLFGGVYAGMQYEKSRSSTSESYTCPKPKYSESYVKSLKTDACSLYENYRNLYLAADSLCNSSTSCKGSASQKEGYETFKSWDDFKKENCK